MTTTDSIAPDTATSATDPIGGMTIPIDQAVATRVMDEQTYYFCSARCVAQFDQRQARSATTGVAPSADASGTLQWIELTLTPASGTTGIDCLQARIAALAKANLQKVEQAYCGR